MDSDMYEIEKPDHATFVEKQLAENDEDKDWEVVVADDKHLLLDFDAPQVPEGFYKLMALDFVIDAIGNDYKVYDSRSGNKHVVVYLKNNLSMLERIAWQATLGSDPKREALAIRSYHDGSLNPILLVMRKDRHTALPQATESGDRKLKTVDDIELL